METGANDLFHSISLIGMKYDKTIPYFDSLPEHFVVCNDFKDFYRLIKGKRNKVKENMEIAEDMEYLIYSPSSKKYYYKTLHEFTNMWRLLTYFKDKNIYIYSEEIRVKKQQEHETDFINDPNDVVLY